MITFQCFHNLFLYSRTHFYYIFHLPYLSLNHSRNWRESMTQSSLKLQFSLSLHLFIVNLCILPLSLVQYKTRALFCRMKSLTIFWRRNSFSEENTEKEWRLGNCRKWQLCFAASFFLSLTNATISQLKVFYFTNAFSPSHFVTCLPFYAKTIHNRILCL